MCVMLFCWIHYGDMGPKFNVIGTGCGISSMIVLMLVQEGRADDVERKTDTANDDNDVRPIDI